MIPKYMSVIWAAIAPALGNHLWQSTLCLVIAGLLTLILRKNHARARHGLWLAASVKFLIPFSLLIGLGSHLAKPRAFPQTEPAFFVAMWEVSQPFTPPAAQVILPAAPSATFPNLDQLLPPILVAMWFCGFVVVLLVWYSRWRRISAAIDEAVPLREGREVEALRRLERLGGIQKRIELMLSPTTLEPGIFGIAKPVLVWPKGISEHLPDAHLEAILAHEVWHVRRRDNLAAAIHMVVEAIFWFHPLVWWLGARLLVERERACDEEVLGLGSERQVYAESILKVCEFCLESPLACVSGVTSSDLKNRMVRIMTGRLADRLSFGRKLLLAAVGIVAVAAPVVFGLVNAPSIRAHSQQSTGALLPSFEVASVKRNLSGENTDFHVLPDRLIVRDMVAETLIHFAYGRDRGRFGYRMLRRDEFLAGPKMTGPAWAGMPSWTQTETYDIDAKVEDSLAEKFRKLDCSGGFFHSGCGYRDQIILMLQSLLADRFKLKVRRETRELPVYALVVAEGGPKFLHTTFAVPDTAPGQPMPCTAGMRCFQHYTSMGQLADWFSGGLLDRPVIDLTGLTGGYYIKLQFAREQRGKPQTPPVFTALQEQLGLKLEPTTGPVEFLVIDHIERPSEN